MAELTDLAPGEGPQAPQGLQAAGSPDLGRRIATNPLFFPPRLDYFYFICFFPFHFEFFTHIQDVKH